MNTPRRPLRTSYTSKNSFKKVHIFLAFKNVCRNFFSIARKIFWPGFQRYLPSRIFWPFLGDIAVALLLFVSFFEIHQTLPWKTSLFHGLVFSSLICASLLLTNASKNWGAYLGFADITRLFCAAFLGVTLCALHTFFIPTKNFLALDELFFLGCVLFHMWFVMRMGAFFFKKRMTIDITTEKQEALLIGLNDHSENLLKTLKKIHNLPYKVIGIFDKNVHHTNHFVHGIPVLGNLGHLAAAVERIAQKGLPPEVFILGDKNISIKDKNNISHIAHIWKIEILEFPEKNKKISTPHKALQLDSFFLPQTLSYRREKVAAQLRDQSLMCTALEEGMLDSFLVNISDLPLRSVTYSTPSLQSLWHFQQKLANLSPHLKQRALLWEEVDAHQASHLFDTLKPHTLVHIDAFPPPAHIEVSLCIFLKKYFWHTKNILDNACKKSIQKVLCVLPFEEKKNNLPFFQIHKILKAYIALLNNLSADTHKDTHKHFFTLSIPSILDGNGTLLSYVTHCIKNNQRIVLKHPDTMGVFLTRQDLTHLVLDALWIKHEEPRMPQDTLIVGNLKSIPVLDIVETACHLYGKQPYKDVEIVFDKKKGFSVVTDQSYYAACKMRQTHHPKLKFINQPFLESKKQKQEFMKMLSLLEEATYKGDQAACVQLLNDLETKSSLLQPFKDIA